ncbi:MAG: pyridoxamine 5'-phosphate oxidase family protein, partial [Chloroflexota bacterium]
VLPDTPEWDELAPLFTLMPGARQIVVNEVMRVQTSCGFAVPLMTYESDRDTLIKYAENKGPDGMVDYRKEKNMTSIDGLPTAFCE